jgi:hypothetical protein
LIRTLARVVLPVTGSPLNSNDGIEPSDNQRCTLRLLMSHQRRHNHQLILDDTFLPTIDFSHVILTFETLMIAHHHYQSQDQVLPIS